MIKHFLVEKYEKKELVKIQFCIWNMRELQKYLEH